MPEVRVGIVSWNAAAELQACLEALPAALDGIAADVVVVDNASRDDSAVVAEKFDVRVVHNLENRGYARAMNQALAGDGADVLIALDPDTVPPPGSLRALVDVLRDHPDIALVAPALESLDGSTEASSGRLPTLRSTLFASRAGAEADTRAGLVDVEWASDAAHVIRASALAGRPPYRERWFMYAEDLELCARLRASGHRVVLDTDVTITHAGGASSALAWGEDRDARRLDALYDWYARAHGPIAARLWAAGNLGAMLLRRDTVDAGSVSTSARDDYRSRRSAARLHLRKLWRGTRLGRVAGEPPADRPRRLLAVVPGGQVSGAEMVLLSDLSAARVEGWTVRCACSDGPLLEELVDAGIAHLPIPDLRLPEGPRPIAYARALARTLVAARRLHRNAGRDEIVIVNGVNVLPAVRVARLKSRVLFFAHDVLVRSDRLQLARLGAAVVDVAVAVSDAVAVPLRAMGIATTVVHNGTPWPVAPAPDVAPTPPIVGCTAVLTEWKGLHVLLEAVTKLARTDAVLELAGVAHPKDGPYADALRARAAQPDLAGRVQFLGFIDDPLATLRRWSVAVSASIDPEAGPLTALEAMSVGVPFVATDHGGVTEVLGDAGLLVPPGDAAALAGAIDRLLSDAALRARCRAAGPKAIVAEHLTRADQRAAMLSIFDELLPVPAR